MRLSFNITVIAKLPLIYWLMPKMPRVIQFGG